MARKDVCVSKCNSRVEGNGHRQAKIGKRLLVGRWQQKVKVVVLTVVSESRVRESTRRTVLRPWPCCIVLDRDSGRVL